MDSTTVVIIVTSVVGLVLGVWALIDLWRGPYPVLGKIGWTFGIIIIPIIVAGLYLLSRPSSKMQQRSYESGESREEIMRKYGRGGDL